MIHNSKVRIMLFGTFDLLHPGHLDFFKQARSLAKNPYVIVSIARDKIVKKIKGKSPQNSERRRALRVKKTGFADRVVLGSLGNHIPHILKEKPSIIALGYDQKAYTHRLRLTLKEAGLPVTIKKLKAFKPHMYKTSLIAQKYARNTSRRKKST